MTIELLSLVALWCGNPLTHSGNGGPEITVVDVNQCRKNVIQCLDNPSEIETVNEAADKCFKKVPYPGKDN
jgi:ribosomal protein L16/L10AE